MAVVEMESGLNVEFYCFFKVTNLIGSYDKHLVFTYKCNYINTAVPPVLSVLWLLLFLCVRLQWKYLRRELFVSAELPVSLGT